MELRNLHVKISADPSSVLHAMEKLDKSTERLIQEYQTLGKTGVIEAKRQAASMQELARVSGISNQAVGKLIKTANENIRLDDEFRSVASSLGLANQKINQVQDSIERAKASTETWKAVLGGLGTLGVSALVGGFAKQGIELAAQAEDVAIQFEVLMGSAEKARETLNTLKQFTKETPFNFDQVSKAGRQLLAVNFQAEELTDVLRMIGDVSKGTGKDFNELATIFAKNKSSNFIQGEDLNQLIEAGIPILDEFGKMFGKTALQVKEMGSKNQIEFKHLMEAFRRMTGEGGKYQNMMQKLSQTSIGLFSQVSDEFMNIAKEFGTMFLTIAKPILEFFSDGEKGSMRLRIALGFLAFTLGVILVKSTLAWASALDVVTLSAMKTYATMIAPIALVVAKLIALYLILEDIWTFFEYGADASDTYFADIMRWLGLTENELQSLHKGFHEIKQVISDFGEKIKLAFQNETFRNIVKWIGIVVVALLLWKVVLISGIVYAIMYVVSKWDKIKETIVNGLTSIWEFIKRYAPMIGKILVTYLFPIAGIYLFRKELMSAFEFLVNYIKNLPFVQKLVEQFMSLKTRLASVFSGMWESLKSTFKSLLPLDVLNTIIEAINWISSKLNEFSSSSIAQRFGITPLNLPVIPRIEARALGGAIQANMPYLVGERGPELIIPKQSGTVIPNEKIRQVQNNSPIIINLHVTTNGNSPKEMAYDLFEAVEEVFKTNANLLRVRMNMEPV